MKPEYCNIIHLSETRSTNEYAKSLLQEERPPEGTLIQADHQTAGKGQDGNSWESEAGKNILISKILYPGFLDVARQFSLSMAVALGMIDFLESFLPGKELFIKWPNDIYVGKEKIGGILINNEIMGEKFEHVICGIGINVNQMVFSKDLANPVSLKILSGKEYCLQELIKDLSSCLMGRYAQLREEEFDQVTSAYHQKLLGIGEMRQYEYLGKKISAKITGVSEYGKLKLQTEDGEIACDLKEIVYLF